MQLRLGGVSTAVLSLCALMACDGPRPVPEVRVEAPVTHTPRSMPAPTPGSDGANSPDGTLLDAYKDRSPSKTEVYRSWQLPFQARAAIAELLILTADDDPERMKELFTPNARFGLPDRRQIQARPIYTEDDPLGLEFLTGFRGAAQRFKKRATFNLEPLPGFEMFAATGAEPVWCSYMSDNKLDYIGLRLVTYQGDVKIDYIGFFEEMPTQRINMANEGDPPPVIPYMRTPPSLTLSEDAPAE